MRPRPVVGEATVPDAVRRSLDKFDYPDRESPAQVIPIFPTLGGGGGAPTVVIAASDATDLSKSKSDFQCLGTNDHVIIQDAVDLMPFDGGRVVLTEGQFEVDWSGIIIGRGVHLMGMGRTATTLNLPSSGGGPVIQTTVGSPYSKITDLTIAMSNLGTSAQIGIELLGDQGLIRDCAILNSEGNGVEVESSADFCQIIGNEISFSTLDNITVEGSYCVVIGNTLKGGGDGIVIFNSPLNGIIANNVILNSEGDGIVVGTSSYFIIDGNRIEAPGQSGTGRGIWLTGGERHIVIANIITDSADHGINLNDTDDSIIADNLIYFPGASTANTYDGIFLENDSDENVIESNRIESNPVNNTRYGLNISAATCDDNSYLGNRTGPAANYGTGAYNDAGTGTVNTWPGAAAPQGDNLL